MKSKDQTRGSENTKAKEAEAARDRTANAELAEGSLADFSP